MQSIEMLVKDGLTIESLMGKSVAVVGYGNQGRAHALNLRDSGFTVLVAGRANSDARNRAEQEGFQTFDTPKACQQAELVILALPDEVHAGVWSKEVAPAVHAGQTIGFIHGSSVHFGSVTIPTGIGVVLVAPKGPGATLRERYLLGQGIPALLAVWQERTHSPSEFSAMQIAKAWATGIGCARAAVVETTFQFEAETDLFGEQSVLCGGMMGLAQAAYETLVEAGYPPLLAYTECIQEIKQVADLLYARGPMGMAAAISNTAEFGTYWAAPRIADEHTRKTMRALLQEIRSGAFTRAMQTDFDAGAPWFKAQQAAMAAHPMEQSSQEVRALMPWLADEEVQRTGLVSAPAPSTTSPSVTVPNQSAPRTAESKHS